MKKVFLFIIAILFVTSTFAQNEKKQGKIYVEAGYGFINPISNDANTFGVINVGVGCYFNTKWGVGINVGYAPNRGGNASNLDYDRAYYASAQLLYKLSDFSDWLEPTFAFGVGYASIESNYLQLMDNKWMDDKCQESAITPCLATDFAVNLTKSHNFQIVIRPEYTWVISTSEGGWHCFGLWGKLRFHF